MFIRHLLLAVHDLPTSECSYPKNTKSKDVLNTRTHEELYIKKIIKTMFNIASAQLCLSKLSPWFHGNFQIK